MLCGERRLMARMLLMAENAAHGKNAKKRPTKPNFPFQFIELSCVHSPWPEICINSAFRLILVRIACKSERRNYKISISLHLVEQRLFGWQFHAYQHHSLHNFSEKNSSNLKEEKKTGQDMSASNRRKLSATFWSKIQELNRIMGCTNGKPVLSDEDLDFIANNTAASRDQVDEHYENFLT